MKKTTIKAYEKTPNNPAPAKRKKEQEYKKPNFQKQGVQAKNPKETMTLTEWCHQQGINPKVARAKLRQSGLKRDGQWCLTSEVKMILKKR